MKNVQKIGGAASFYLGFAYIIGIVFFLFVLDYPNITGGEEKLGLLQNKGAFLYATNILMYVLFSLVFIVFTLALYNRIDEKDTYLMKVAAIIGCIWSAMLMAGGMVANAGIGAALQLLEKSQAEAVSFWFQMETVSNGLGQANGEILGGCFTLLVSVSAMRGKKLPKIVNILGIIIGGIGIASIIPLLHDLAGLFGMGQVIWFLWVGVVLLTNKKNEKV